MSFRREEMPKENRYSTEPKFCVVLFIKFKASTDPYGSFNHSNMPHINKIQAIHCLFFFFSINVNARNALKDTRRKQSFIESFLIEFCASRQKDRISARNAR